jgi:uncharacterized protein
MSPDPFPEQIDAVKLFSRNGAINAVLQLARLPRLIDCLADATGTVLVDLRFSLDDEGRRHLSGTLDAPVKLICQRCLQELQMDLHSELQLLVIDSDEALQELPEHEDAVVMDAGQLDLPALIEDELLLSLPLVPLHEDAGCNAAFNQLRVEVAQAATASPFAALAALKGSNDN